MKVKKPTKTYDLGKQRKVAKALWEAKTAQEVREALDLLEGLVGGLKWRSVGDIDDNAAPITASSDAALAMNERLTNGIDAVLELAARLKYGTDFVKASKELGSPRAAARKLMGVPAGGIHKMTLTERQALADKVEMVFAESGVSNKPTVIVHDRGIGQSPEDMPHTILSIYGGNKRDKSFLMGVYGWGGSNTFGFAEYTVIISRRHSSTLDGRGDRVALTVVAEKLDDTMRAPAYLYAVDEDKDVIGFDPKAFDGLDLPHGTRIAHVEYEHGIKGALINQYNFFSTALFEPVLPVWVGSYRGVDSHAGRRVVRGVADRLEAPDDEDSRSKVKVRYRTSARLDLDSGSGAEAKTVGSATVKVWVLEKDGASPSADLAGSFLPGADNVLVMTLNGQRQDAESRGWVKREGRLTYLYKRVIIQVVADDLDRAAKADVFSSTRERSRGGETRDRILAGVRDLLRSDATIRSLEDDLYEEAMKNTAEKASEKDLDKLAKAIGKLGGRTKEVDVEVEVEVEGPEPRGGGTKTPPDYNDSHLPETPTELEFEVHEMEAEQGGSKKRLMVKLDAKNGWLPAHEGLLDISVVGPQGETRDVYPHTRHELKGGRAQWLVETTKDAPLGEYKLVATITLDDGTVLSDDTRITVIERKDKGGKGSSKKGGTRKQKRMQKQERPAGPNVRYVNEDNWKAHGFDKQTIGSVQETDKGVEILLNLDEQELKKVLKSRRLTAGQIAKRKSKYMVPTALGLYRIHQAESKGLIDESVVGTLQQVVGHSVLWAVDEDSLLEEVEDD